MCPITIRLRIEKGGEDGREARHARAGRHGAAAPRAQVEHEPADEGRREGLAEARAGGRG